MTDRPDLVIRGGRLLAGPGRPPAPADIMVSGDTIAAIAAPGTPAPDDARTIDATDRLIHAGLICGHTHGNTTFGKGQGDRWTLELLQTAGPWLGSSGKGFTLEERYLLAQVGALEMLMKGCTSCFDMNAEFPAPSVAGMQAVAQAYLDAGMRAVIAPMLAEYTLFEAVPGLMDAFPEDLRRQVGGVRLGSGEASLDGMRAVLADWPFDTDRVRLAMAPTIPHYCSDGFMQACARLAREHGLMIQSHVEESRLQAVASHRIYGRTQVAHMDALGVLGPDFVAGHGVWLDDDDMRRLADRGASIVINPGSNMRLGNGLPDSRRMLDFSINLAIGTDGAHCSDNLNMYEAMRTASRGSRVQSLDTERWLSTAEVMRAATEGSAQALGLAGKVGRLEPGYKADLVLLRLDHVNWMPLNDATNQLVHAEDGTGVDTVMVGGRVVVADRRPVGVDMTALMHRVEAARARIAEMNRPVRALTERLAVVVNAFCPNLAREPYHVCRMCGD